MDADGRVRFRVVSVEDGMMLRQLLCRRFTDLGPQEAADLIKAGGVYLANVRVRIPSVRVVQGERITVYRGARGVPEVAPADLRIVARGADFVVVDKPAGVPASSTRASARGTVAQALIHRLGEEGVLRPYVGPIRPIPPEVAGLVLFTVRGQDALSSHQRFLDAAIEAVDRLWVRGEAAPERSADAPLLLTRSGRLRVVAAGAHGATPALTRFRCLITRGAGEAAASLLEGRAIRGEGAQAMVHAAALGHPALHAPVPGEGDPYRDPERPSGELLVARVGLRFTHPETGERVDLTVDGPAWTQAEGSPADADAEALAADPGLRGR